MSIAVFYFLFPLRLLTSVGRKFGRYCYPFINCRHRQLASTWFYLLAFMYIVGYSLTELSEN